MKKLKKLMFSTMFAVALFTPVLGLAVPIQLTYMTSVTSGGTPGVSDGDILTLEILADNGGADLISQSWFQTDVISAEATVGTYVAQFNFPHFTNDPVFVTNALGMLTTTLWFDIDGNNTDNLGLGSPGFFSNALLTSQSHFIGFQDTQPQTPSAWRIGLAEDVPAPGTLALTALGLLLVRRRRTRNSGEGR